MLRACHRVLKHDGILAIAVIAIAHDLTDDQIASAVAAGPPRVEAGPGYPQLVADAGFASIDVVDVTDDYRSTLTALIREWDAQSHDLAPIVGDDVFAEQQENRSRALDAVEQGLLRRSLISARRR